MQPQWSEVERAWAAAKDTTSITVLEDLISRYKDSFYAGLARARIEELKKQQVAVVAPPPAAKPVPSKPAQPAVSIAPIRVPQTQSAYAFVVQLSSQTSRADAIKSAATLQEKYKNLLVGRVLGLQTQTGEKGTWYRVVVGPPVSNDAANIVCANLKAAGANCFVTKLSDAGFSPLTTTELTLSASP